MFKVSTSLSRSFELLFIMILSCVITNLLQIEGYLFINLYYKKKGKVKNFLKEPHFKVELT